MKTLTHRNRVADSVSAVRSRLERGSRRELVHALAEAARRRDREQLQELLHPEVAVVVDAGEPERSAIRVVRGRDDATALLAHGFAPGPGIAVEERAVNSQAGLVVTRAGVPSAAIAVDFAGDLVSLIWIRLDPPPLRHGMVV